LTRIDEAITMALKDPVYAEALKNRAIAAATKGPESREMRELRATFAETARDLEQMRKERGIKRGEFAEAALGTTTMTTITTTTSLPCTTTTTTTTTTDFVVEV
jgi:hypothetical protein